MPVLNKVDGEVSLMPMFDYFHFDVGFMRIVDLKPIT